MYKKGHDRKGLWLKKNMETKKKCTLERKMWCNELIW